MTIKTKKKRIRRTPEYFEREVDELTNGEYTPLSPFVKMHEKVEMLHKTCGNTWEVLPHAFLCLGNRCPRCAVNYSPTTEEYTQKVVTLTAGEYVVQGDYEGALKKIPMLHTVCGNTWEVSPSKFINDSSRCPRCSSNARGTTVEFRERVETLTDGGYVVRGEYEGARKKIPMFHTVCSKVFEVLPSDFLYRPRCPHCSGKYSPTTEEYKERVFELVGGEYIVKGEYVTANTPIPMRHTTCGHEWGPTPKHFLNGSRCPNCIYSQGEKAVADALDSLSIDYTREYSFEPLGLKRFDFYLPDHSIAIEYDGKQHFEAVDHWGGEEALKRTQESDALKNAFCEQNGIDLLRIPYWEFDNIPEIVSNYINSVRHLDSLLQEA